jgi:2'-5' RNA ligase
VDLAARYAVVVFPDAETSAVERFRMLYDPLAHDIPAHITLVHPFDWPGTLDELAEIVADAVATRPPFPVRFDEVRVWEDEYVFLVPGVGGTEIVALRELLIGGALADLVHRGPFTPHITVARSTDPDRLDRALQDATLLAVVGHARGASIYRVEPAGARTGQVAIGFPCDL